MKMGLRGACSGTGKQDRGAPKQAAEEQISCEKRKGVGSGLLMGSDREWETEFAGKAWAGHIGDTGIWVGLGLDRSRIGS